MRLSLMLLVAATTLPAATISGRVYDPSGAVVPGAAVQLSSAGAAKKESSGADGTFRFQSLTAGSYDLTVAVPGFVLFERSGIKLADNTDHTMAVLLKLGAIEESLEIRASGRLNPQPAAPTRVRVGGSLRPAKLLHREPPVYPESARAAGHEGMAVVRAVISTEGKVLSASTLSGVPPDLAEAAEQAVRAWQYEPLLLNGQPVEAMTTVQVNFRLR